MTETTENEQPAEDDAEALRGRETVRRDRHAARRLGTRPRRAADCACGSGGLRRRTNPRGETMPRKTDDDDSPPAKAASRNRRRAGGLGVRSGRRGARW